MINQNLGVKIYVNPPAITNVKLTVTQTVGSGGSVDRVYHQKPTGLINGMNATFIALSPFKPETLDIWVSGIYMEPVEDYILISNTTIELKESPVLGEKVLISYTKA